jgi:hypothetical protein
LSFYQRMFCLIRFRGRGVWNGLFIGLELYLGFRRLVCWIWRGLWVLTPR